MAVSRRRLVDDRLGQVASGDHRVRGCGRAMLAMGEGRGQVAVGNTGARLGRARRMAMVGSKGGVAFGTVRDLLLPSFIRAW